VTRFDRYVVVDWSAASRPATGADSIWIAVLDDGEQPDLANPPTRSAAAALLRELRGSDRRTLVAIDASLGYPAGTAAWFGLGGGPPWRAMWNAVSELLTDTDDNRNNRFEVAEALNRRGGGGRGHGPFWGRPASLVLAALATTKPSASPVGEFRQCELAVSERGLRPASTWQLLGAGSVGSQTLTLLPLLDALVAAGGVEIWPFTTGPSPRELVPGEVLVVETWPTMFDVDTRVGGVRDAAQVTSVAVALRAADRGDRLDGWFAIDATGSDLAAVVDEEGWILGPTSNFRPRTRDSCAGS
jgi:precorrin-8X/cobalt-precorrin-8 methylmutase